MFTGHFFVYNTVSRIKLSHSTVITGIPQNGQSCTSNAMSVRSCQGVKPNYLAVFVQIRNLLTPAGRIILELQENIFINYECKPDFPTKVSKPYADRELSRIWIIELSEKSAFQFITSYKDDEVT